MYIYLLKDLRYGMTSFSVIIILILIILFIPHCFNQETFIYFENAQLPRFCPVIVGCCFWFITLIR